MAKRKLDLNQLRDLVRSRRTKGSAFMLDHKAYQAEQDKVRAELEAMSFSEILNRWPEFTHDVQKPLYHKPDRA